MSLLVFDIGGQSVKHAVWANSELVEKGSFKTPNNWEALLNSMIEVVEARKVSHKVDGVGISAPGSIDNKAGVIGGTSALPYIHEFKIVEAWEEAFALSVSMENDANCAALAELGYGVAKDYNNVAFMIIGTGIGGAVAMNGELVKGRHLFAGEFGYMLMDPEHTLSREGSSYYQINLHNKANPDAKIENGKELFDLAASGDHKASEIVDGIYDALARGIYNLSLIIDPELIAIGGGISVREDIVDELMARTKVYLEREGAMGLEPNIQVCQFFNDANLIGAAVNYQRGNN